MELFFNGKDYTTVINVGWTIKARIQRRQLWFNFDVRHRYENVHRKRLAVYTSPPQLFL